MTTQEKFGAYVTVQESGKTNMFATNAVTELADEMCDVELTREDCLEIMKDYSELKEKFNA